MLLAKHGVKKRQVIHIQHTYWFHRKILSLRKSTLALQAQFHPRLIAKSIPQVQVIFNARTLQDLI